MLLLSDHTKLCLVTLSHSNAVDALLLRADLVDSTQRLFDLPTLQSHNTNDYCSIYDDVITDQLL